MGSSPYWPVFSQWYVHILFVGYPLFQGISHHAIHCNYMGIYIWSLAQSPVCLRFNMNLSAERITSRIRYLPSCLAGLFDLVQYGILVIQSCTAISSEVFLRKLSIFSQKLAVSFG